MADLEGRESFQSWTASAAFQALASYMRRRGLLTVADDTHPSRNKVAIRSPQHPRWRRRSSVEYRRVFALHSIRGDAVNLHEHQYADVLVLDLAGKINHNGADAFRDALIPCVDSPNASYRMIILNLTKVEYMSSVGLRGLMLAAKQSKAVDRPIVVAGLNETMREIFQVSRFDLIFDVYEDVIAAISVLSVAALAAYRAELEGG